MKKTVTRLTIIVAFFLFNPVVMAVDWTFDGATIVAAANPQNDKLTVLNTRTLNNDIFYIDYEDGTPADRLSAIVPDPDTQGGDALHYWLKNAAIGSGSSAKGRIQMNAPNLALDNVYQSFRLFLHPDLSFYKLYANENGWFTVSELFMGNPGDAHRFRITLNIGKPQGIGQPLLLTAAGSKRTGGTQGNGTWEDLWAEGSLTHELPLNEWIDVMFAYAQGDAANGRFVVQIKRAIDPEPQPIVDVTNWTYHPDAPLPVPLTLFNPAKLYTSDDIINHIRNSGGVAQVYFDDMTVWSVGG